METTTRPTPQQVEDILRLASHGDDSAYQFLRIVMEAIELWDDCIDGDQPLIPSTVHTVFFGLLVGIPVNVFYRTNMPYLAGLMVASINAWWDANDLMTAHDPRAWYLRHLGIELIPAVAFLTGGLDLMRTVSQALRALPVPEPFEEFQKEQIPCH